MGALAFACGKAPVGLGGTGTLDGYGAFPVKAAYFHLNEVPPDPNDRNGGATQLEVQLLEQPLTCEQYLAAPQPFDGGIVGVELSPGPIQVGTYPLQYRDGMYSLSYSGVWTPQVQWWSGHVDLTTVSDDRVAGQFDAVDGPMDGGTVSLSGRFDAVRCNPRD